MGFVQADPIRAPARAQDLILRHRVNNYRAGELERRYTVWAVGQTGGHRGKAAEKLDIDPKTLRKLLEAPDDD